MTNVFVEPRPKGKPEGTPIRDFVVEDHADHELAAFKTQEDAIFWARTHGYTPHVARVRISTTRRGRTIGDAFRVLRFVSCYPSPADVIASLLMAASASLSRKEVLVLALAVRPPTAQGSRMMDIREHMEIVDVEGTHIGTVDRVEGDRIKMTKKDSRDGQHHFLNTKQVARCRRRQGETQPEGVGLEVASVLELRDQFAARVTLPRDVRAAFNWSCGGI